MIPRFVRQRFSSKSALSLAVTLSLAPAFLHAQDRTLEIDDLRLEVELATPVLSPDGQRAVVRTSTPNYDDNRFDKTLILVDIATGAQRELTPQRPRVGGARWSPLGDRLGFTGSAEPEDRGEDEESGGGGDSDGVERRRQVFVLPMDGGGARQITHAKEGVEDYDWTADGKHILYTSREPAAKLEGEERHNKSFEVGNHSYLAQEASRSAHLWKAPLDGGVAQRLTEGAEHIGSFVVSPDGTTVALEVWPTPHTADAYNNSVRLLDLESGETRQLLTGFYVELNEFSLDGRYLAFARPRGAEPYFNPSGMFVKSIDGDETIDATALIDRSLDDMAWLPDGQSILVNGSDLTARALWYQPLDGAPRRLDLGDIHAETPVVARDGTVVFLGVETHRPAELYTMRVGEWRPRRLTNFNGALAGMKHGRVETVTWDGPDGFGLNGVLVYPPDYKQGRRYPLVLNIHGGPMWASHESFDTFNQIMAARGWLVFGPNYRGSSSQGKAFQSAVINDAGDGPGRDVMSGIEVLKKRGIVDEARVAASGWSYGGYMTAWLTAHFGGWATAVAGAAVTDWFDWYNLADYNVWSGYGLGGSPWRNGNAMNYWRQSPMAYAHQIRTPTLILSNTGDERVTVSQSYKLYHALKDNEVEVKFIAYPVPGHWPDDPVHTRDLYRRWVEWIARHF